MPDLMRNCLLVAAAALAGCATTPPLDASGVALDLEPAQVVEDFASHAGQRVLWGGVIVASRNLAEVTELEMLAFPLDPDSYWPDTGATALGRFLLRQPGYLETLDYAPGRYLSAVGELVELRSTAVGGAQIDYPLVQARAIHLWKRPPRDSQTQFRIGIGVIFSN